MKKCSGLKHRKEQTQTHTRRKKWVLKERDKIQRQLAKNNVTGVNSRRNYSRSTKMKHTYIQGKRNSSKGMKQDTEAGSRE